MLDVALEVPLGAFAFGWLVQSNHAGPARVEVLGEPLDGAALTRGVPPLEGHDELLPGVLDPALQLQQFDLQPALRDLVLAALQSFGVRVPLAPRLDQASVGAEELAVVVPVLIGALVGQIVESPLA